MRDPGVPDRIYHSRAPRPPLGEFIERLWYCSDAPAHECERILPSGTVELVINLRDDEIRIGDPSEADPPVRRYSGAVLSGPYGRYFAIDTRQHASILGVHFRPGGAWPFFGMPTGEFADAHVDLDAVWGRAAVELRERVCAAKTPNDRFRLVEEALLHRLDERSRGHRAVRGALVEGDRVFRRTGSDPTVRDLSRQVGLSERRFIQIFTAQVGLTPKLFSRVQRFQRACAMARGRATPDWAGLAAGCGYYDQSHLIRDFQAFAGLSPGRFLRPGLERVMLHHVPQVG